MLMRYGPFFLACFLVLSALGTAGQAQTAKPSLESLIEKFHSESKPLPADVQIDAWIEKGDGNDEPNTFFITIQPDGDTRLNADPGITVTPADQPGLDWQLALPHRHVDGTITYFEPPATIAMPFTGIIGQPVEVLVEYAYCFVDFQCFFGEKTLRVDMIAPGRTG